MNYQEWLEEVPEEVTGDSLWKMKVYRLALFVADLGWRDVTKLIRDKRTIGLADQLYRALVLSARTSRKDMDGFPAKTELASTNTRFARPERAVTGTTRGDTF